MSSSQSDVEAQFRLRLFALLGSSPALRQLVISRSRASGSARLDLARFLAGYYLGFDFARLFERINRCHPTMDSRNTKIILPNLLVWAEQDEEDEESDHDQEHFHHSSTHRLAWDRSRLGQLLPPECSANYVLSLLLRECHYLEAIFFTDHFNDSRTSMALRFLTDLLHPGLNLFGQFCQTSLADQLLDYIENDQSTDENDPQTAENHTLEWPIHRHIEAIILADVLFSDQFGTSTGFLFDCLSSFADSMGKCFAKLLEFDGIDDEATVAVPSPNTVRRLGPQLPRPPIFCCSSDIGTPSSSAASDTDPEYWSWLTLHKCSSAIVLALARSNHLDQLVGFFALWLAQQQQNANGDFATSIGGEVPFLLEAQFFTSGDTELELKAQLDTFQTLFSIVLGMQIRDKIVQKLFEFDTQSELRRDTNNSARDSLTSDAHAAFASLAAPFAPTNSEKFGQKQRNGLVWPSLKRWAQFADQNDFQNASLFLHTIQQQNISTRRFLLPLNAQNRPKWSSLLLADGSDNVRSPPNDISGNWLGHTEVFVEEEHKFKLNLSDFVRLRFLAHHFPSVPLRPPLIQMLLGFDPCDKCAVVDVGQGPNLGPIQPKTQKLQLITDEKEKKGEDGGEEEEEDGLDALITQIRTSLKRLEEEMDDQDQQDHEEPNSDLNWRQNGDQGIVASSSERGGSTEEEQKHLRQVRKRLQTELIRRQQQTMRIPMSSTAEEMPKSRSSSRRSRSSSRPNLRRRRRRKTRRSMKQQRESSSSGVSVIFGNSGKMTEEEGGGKMGTDDQLMEEMDAIGSRLEQIREHFQRQNANLLMSEEGELRRSAEEEREGGEIGSSGREEEEGVGGGFESGSGKDEEEGEGVDVTKGPEGAGTSRIGTENVPEKSGTESHEKNIDMKPVSPAESALSTANHERESETKGQSPRPASSAGYHSSRPTTYVSSNDRNANVILNGNDQIGTLSTQNWPPMAPPRVERMDFSGLRSSDEEEMGGRGEGNEVEKTKKKKSRVWTEIEVFPRNTPPPMTSVPPLSNPSASSETFSKSENSHQRQRQDSGNRRAQWRRPQWLRLLPPFDGTIRTDRRAPPIRPLLELKLDEPIESVTGVARGIRRHRTFLELAAKSEMESMRRSKEHQQKMAQRDLAKTEDIKREKRTKPGWYDSGIELDQQQQQNNSSRADGEVVQQQKNNHDRTNGEVVVLYSVELNDAEMEEMRRRAGD